MEQDSYLSRNKICNKCQKKSKTLSNKGTLYQNQKKRKNATNTYSQACAKKIYHKKVPRKYLELLYLCAF